MLHIYIQYKHHVVNPKGPFYGKHCMVVNEERQVIFGPVLIVPWITDLKNYLLNSQMCNS